MTIKSKLHLSFAIFIFSLMIPAFVGIKAISVIRGHQQMMLDISDLTFTQMELASTVGSALGIHKIEELDALQNKTNAIQQRFSHQIEPFSQLKDPSFQTYADAIIDDERNLNELSQQLFGVRRDFINSQLTLQKKLGEHHYTPPAFLKMISTADDVSIIESMIHIANSGSYALYNGMKETDVNVWLEAVATLKQKLLGNAKLKTYHQQIEQSMSQRRAFIIDMVSAARGRGALQVKEDELILQFSHMVERNILHGHHSKKQLISNVEAAEKQAILFKGAAIIFMLVIAVLISTYLTRSIARSINNMKKAVSKVSGGDLTTTMEEKGNNEFSALANAFNDMTGELHSARQEMAQHNQLLEQRIEERTGELKEAIASVELNNRSLQKLSAQLSKYLSPQLFKSIFSGKQEVRLETSRKKLTVFFSDIQGFTQLTDTMDPEAMTMILNDYLNAMTHIAIDHGGTIDKFIGDAVMVFFGDPETQGIQQDAINCVNMAIAMRLKMAQLKTHWQSHGYKVPFHIRIGINTGYCTVGNFGAEDRMDYTIVGGNVNLASRLESQAKTDQILISSDTHQLIQDNIKTAQCDEISVKGIAKPVQTFEVFDHQQQKPDNIQRQQQGFNLDIDFNKIEKSQAKAWLKSALDDLQ
ncbi:MAG: adenylate cyclase [Phenylobacterium sp.]|jgi:adenylate cyclase